jgi:hypothetical protein
LRKHYNRKTPCQVADTGENIDTKVLMAELEKKYNDTTYDCEWCSKKFNNKSNLCAHRKTCKARDTDIELLRAEVSELRKLLNGPKGNQTNIQQQTNIEHQNVQNIQINLNGFGQESIDHIKPEFLTQCLLNINRSGVPKLLEELHFNDEVPDNRNIRIRSTKNNLLEKYSDGQWLLCDKVSLLDDMIRRGYRILHKHFLDVKDIDESVKMNEDVLNQMFVDLMGPTGNKYYRIRRDIYVIILNNTVYFVGR